MLVCGWKVCVEWVEGVCGVWVEGVCVEWVEGVCGVGVVMQGEVVYVYTCAGEEK